MSTVEKQLVQIFERKNQIIEQLKHRTDAFDHHLCSKLIIEGLDPPPWLLDPSFQASSSDPKGTELLCLAWWWIVMNLFWDVFGCLEI